MLVDGKERIALAANVRRLMEAAALSQMELSRRSGVAQTTISNVVNPERGSVTVETVTALASALRVPAWTLLMEDMPPELARSPALRILIDNYLHATPDGRRALDRIGEIEAAYSADPGLKDTKRSG